MEEFAELLSSLYDKRIDNIRRAKTTHLRYGFNAADIQFSISNAVVIIYANWEGFVKEAASEYLQFINRQQAAVEDLDEHYYTLLVDQYIELKKTIGSKAVAIKRCCSLREALVRFPGFTTTVSTKSNANCDIVNGIFSRFAIEEIISVNTFGERLNRLLFFRHSIAHGSGTIRVTQKDIDEFSLLVQDMMVMICEKLINAVSGSIWIRADRRGAKEVSNSHV